MVVFPIVVILFFTSLMNEGTPEDMPVGIVDQDNTSTTRALIRNLDAFQTTRVVAHYPNINEARQAIQRNEIYAFLLIPKGTTDGLLSSRRPKISFYYSSVSLVAGSNHPYLRLCSGRFGQVIRTWQDRQRDTQLPSTHSHRPAHDRKSVGQL